MGLVKQINQGNVIIAQGESGCCPDVADAICKHTFIIEDLASITSITIDDNVHTIEADDETSPGQILAAIEAAFIAEGYVETNNKEMIPNIKVFIDEWVDSQTVILIYTNAESVELTTVPVVTETYIACEKTVVCRYRLRIPVGAGLSFEISDSDIEAETEADSPQVVDGDFATGGEAALAAELDLEFGELYANTENATLSRVRVIEAADGFYDADVWLYGRHPNLTTDDEDIIIELQECTVDYTIAN